MLFHRIVLLHFVCTRYRRCQIPGGMTFTVDSDLNRESPQLTLTCTSTGGPAILLSLGFKTLRQSQEG